jgi:hypothetical protein
MKQFRDLGLAEDPLSLRGYLGIDNDSDFDADVLGVRVATNGKTIDRTEPGPLPEPNWGWTVPKGTKGTARATWDFRHPGHRLDGGLGQTIIWIWTVRIGGAEHEVRIRMEREKD